MNPVMQVFIVLNQLNFLSMQSSMAILALKFEMDISNIFSLFSHLSSAPSRHHRVAAGEHESVRLPSSSLARVCFVHFLGSDSSSLVLISRLSSSLGKVHVLSVHGHDICSS